MKSDCKGLWDKVNKVLGRHKSNPECSLTSEELNLHYANQSRDTDYEPSPLKHTCYNIDISCGVSELSVFYMLDKLKPTAAGPDGLQSWFLKLCAPSIAKPLSHIFSLSLATGIVPSQWKSAQIIPIPKISQPIQCADFRPISLTPIPSRIFEKLVVKEYIYPIFSVSSISKNFQDQFAFRPSGSTTAALITIFQHVTTLLQCNDYVRLVAFDLSKAFDTVRHSCVLHKLSNLPVDDSIYNWFQNVFLEHKHCTKTNNSVSDFQYINSSVFQGSAIGPSMFIINSSDLKPLSHQNYLDKYADDMYLITASSNENTLNMEIDNIERWSSKNNLKLNKNKSQEIVFHKSSHSKNSTLVPLIPNIPRVEEINILGVNVQDNFSFTTHVDNICASACQNMYAVKLLKSHNMCNYDLHAMFNAFVLSRLTYAAPAWWGFLRASERQKLQSVLNKCTKWGIRKTEEKSFEEIVESLERSLFNKILRDSNHPLHHLLPPERKPTYNLRSRTHNYTLPAKGNSTYNNNFLCRMLFKNAY